MADEKQAAEQQEKEADTPPEGAGTEDAQVDLDAALEAEWDKMQAAEDAADGLPVASADEGDPGEAEQEESPEAAPKKAAEGQEGKPAVPEGAAGEGEEAAGDAAPKPGDGTSEGDALWATATPEQRAAFAAERHARQSDSNRVAALQRKIDALEARQTQMRVPRPKQAEGDPLKPLKDLQGDFPDLAEPLQAVVSPLAERLAQLETALNRNAQVAAEDHKAHVDNELAKLDRDMPGWDGFIKQHRSQIALWADDQNAATRAMYRRNQGEVTSADEVMGMLEKYARDTGLLTEPEPQPDPAPPAGDKPATQQLDEDRARQLAGMDTPRSRGSRPVQQGIAENADEASIWEQMEEQEERRR